MPTRPAHPVRGLLCGLLCGLAFLLLAGSALGFGVGPGELALLLIPAPAVAYLTSRGTRPDPLLTEPAATRNAHGSPLQNEHA